MDRDADRTVSAPRESRTLLARALNAVERAGDRLPHTATLFVALSVVVVLVSWLVASLGVTVVHPASGEVVGAVNLVSAEGLRRLIVGLLPNFVGFAPFGPVLVCLLGLSVAEKSGFLAAIVRVSVLATPTRLLTAAVVFVGAMSHTASDVGYVLLIPLAATLFHSAGRHPLAGLAAAYAGVSGGFAANVLLSPTDVVLAGLTQDAARILSPGYQVSPMASYYFLAASVVLVTVTGTVVTERIVEPRLGRYTGEVEATATEPLTSHERRALRWALTSVLVLIALMVLGAMGADAPLRDPTRPGLLDSMLIRGIVFWIFVLGLVPGIVYGVLAGTIRRDRDVYEGMQANIGLIAGYIVVVFFIAQFIALFSWSNLGVLLAVTGADALRALDVGVMPLMVGVIVLTALIDLLMGSASAKWSLLAPVLVPMLMALGYSPELTQTAYRVGDSLTNIITPLSANFPLVLMFAQRYRAGAGVGTIAATMLPYTLVNFVVWTLALLAWVWVGWPTGPGAPLGVGH